MSTRRDPWFAEAATRPAQPGPRTGPAAPGVGGVRRRGRARARLDGPGSPPETPALIRILSDMPPGVLGLEAVDDVEKEDYENVLVPAVERAIAEHGKVRLVYVLGPAFDEYEGDAVWEDLKLGARHPASFERMAIVTDARWAGPATKLFSILWPGKARAFPLVQLDAAKRWAAEDAEA